MNVLDELFSPDSLLHSNSLTRSFVEMTCWQWDLMNPQGLFNNHNREKYMRGEFDDKLSALNNEYHIVYIRSDQEIPDWVYNPPKNKRGKRTTRSLSIEDEL